MRIRKLVGGKGHQRRIGTSETAEPGGGKETFLTSLPSLHIFTLVIEVNIF